MLTADYTNQFKKDYKLAIKRGLNIDLLDDIIRDLVNEIPLPIKNREHYLTGDYKNCKECHIKPNWLLVYQIKNNILVLCRTGSHADLF
jgi:mRNA interferase YafQ